MVEEGGWGGWWDWREVGEDFERRWEDGWDGVGGGPADVDPGFVVSWLMNKYNLRCDILREGVFTRRSQSETVGSNSAFPHLREAL